MSSSEWGADKERWNRPHYVVFPKDPKGFAVDDQYFIGSSGILVKPITTKGATETTVYLAEDEVRQWPDLYEPTDI